MAPIEEWISSIRDSIEVQRLANFPAIMMEWIARFEEHPDPKDACGVDYQAMYFYVAELLEVLLLFIHSLTGSEHRILINIGENP